MTLAGKTENSNESENINNLMITTLMVDQYCCGVVVGSLICITAWPSLVIVTRFLPHLSFVDGSSSWTIEDGSELSRLLGL